MKESLSKCDPTLVPSTQNIPNDGIVGIRFHFTPVGFKYLLPAEMSADLPALMKCIDTSANINIPKQLFGSYRSPFDLKEMLINPSKSHLIFYFHNIS